MRAQERAGGEQASQAAPDQRSGILVTEAHVPSRYSNTWCEKEFARHGRLCASKLSAPYGSAGSSASHAIASSIEVKYLVGCTGLCRPV